MKSWSKWISLLLVFVMLLGTFAGCVPENDNPTGGGSDDPTEPSGPNIEYQPQRPADPGVIPPLDDSGDAPENGVVWDMENLPDDLLGAGWVSAKYSDQDAYVAGRTTFTGAAGKGYQGSRAMAIRQNGEYNWSDVFSLGLVMDDTAVRKWAWGGIFWVWYDTTASPGSIMMELEANSNHMKIGSNYYVMEDGAKTAELAGTLPEGYNGAGYARIPLQGGFKGWVGVDVEAFNTNLKKVNALSVHFTNIVVGSTIYLDNFCMSDAGPMGAELSMVNKNVAGSDKPAWDMENLPNDLMAAYWASMEYASSTTAGNFQVLSAPGKGVKGSKALRFFQAGEYNWADGVAINIKNDSTALNGWGEGDVLWFYADATEMRNNVSFDLWLDNVRPAEGTPVYGINEQGKIVEAYKMAPAWTGQTFGRVLVGAGYKGWVGVPLSAYDGNLSNVMNLYFHLSYSSSDGNANRSLYLDEFWILKEGQKPKNATGANMDVLAGKVPVAGSDFTVPGEVFSADNLPAEGWFEETYKSNDNYEAGHVALSIAAGKGYKGSAALQFLQATGYHWSSVFEINITKDSAAVTDWLSNKNVLWFYVDASEHTASVGIDLTIDGKDVKHGGEYYIVPDNASNGTIETIPEAYTGAGKGRLVLPAGFKGWVGAMLSEWGTDVFGGSKLRFHLGYSGSDDVAGKSTYIDSFWLTKTSSAPNGKPAIKPVGGTWDKGGQLWWQPETLPGTLYTGDNPPLILGGGTPGAHDQYKDYIMGSVVNKGISGSAALKYAYLKNDASKNWDFDLAIHWENSSFKYDVNGYDMIWYWVDTTEFANGVNLAMELHFSQAKNAVFYTWDGKNDPVPATSNEWGKCQLPAGFKGYVGLYLKDYVAGGFKMGEMWHIGFHFQPSDSEVPAAIYIDQIWLTNEGQVPNVTLGENDVANAPTAAPEAGGAQLWAPEKLPADPYTMPDDAGNGDKPALSVGEYQSQTGIADYFQYVTLGKIPGKGIGGSDALEYTIKQNHEKNWDFTAVMHWKYSSFAYNWKDLNAEMLWFWIDTTGSKEAVNFEVQLSGAHLDMGAIYYTWDGKSAPVLNVATAAYNGASYSRIPLVQGYKGYIGIPLSGYSTAKLGEMWKMRFYFGINQSTTMPATVYLDEFWVTGLNEVPGVTMTEDDYFAGNVPTPDPDPEPDPEPEPVVGVDKLWDPHSLPEDPYTGDYPALQVGYPGQVDDYAPYVAAYKAANKGVGGTSALAYEYKQTLDGKDWAFSIKVHWQYSSFQYDWATNYPEADILWFWIDTTGAADAVNLELQLDGKKQAMDTVHYTWDGKNAPVEHANTEAYNGAGYSRIPLEKGYKGFVGVKLSDFTGLNLGGVWTMYFYFAGNGQSALPATLYFDEFWLTAADKLPDVTLGENDYAAGGDPVIPEEPEGFVKGGSQLWDPTKLPNDPYTLPSDAGNGDKPALNFGEYNDVSAYIYAKPVIGKGYNLGKSLGIEYKTNPEGLAWDCSVTMHWKYSSFSYDWSNAEIFWFWVDASEFETALRLELQLAGKKLKTDGIFYTWNGVDQPVENALTEAYNGAGYARIPLAKGYTGFVGLKLSDFDGLDAGGIWTVKFYFECADDLNNLPKTLHIDEFWLGKANEMPNVDEPITRGGHHLWDAENLEGNVLSSTSNGSDAAVDSTYPNNVTAQILADKGFNGSKALGYGYLKMPGSEYWGNHIRIHWQRAGWNMLPVEGNWGACQWGDQEMLWFWIDASEFSSSISLRVKIEGKSGAGSKYYFWDGVNKPKVGGTISADNYDNISLSQGYRGWMGVELSSFVTNGLNLDNVWDVLFYIEPWGDRGSDGETVNKTLYIDELWLTKKNEVPNVTLQLNKGGHHLWDAENLEGNVLSSGDDTAVKTYFPGSVTAEVVGSKGYAGSKALAYGYQKMKNDEYWGNQLSVHWQRAGWKPMEGQDYASTWTGNEMLWFWIDTKDYNNGIDLRVKIEGKEGTGSKYYFWDGATEPVEGGTLSASTYTSFQLPAGYVGWIGIELSGYVANGLNLGGVWDVVFYTEPWNYRGGDDGVTINKTMYIDELWLTKLGQVPNI